MNSTANSWVVAILLGLILVLISFGLLLDLRAQRGAGLSTAQGAGWAISCSGSFCAAIDAEGNSFWGVRQDGPPPAGGFRWYRSGRLGEAERFGISQCREMIRAFESQQAELRGRLSKLPDPDKPAGAGGDAVEAAQQRMLARIERMDVQKRLDKLEADQSGPVAECRKMIEEAQ